MERCGIPRARFLSPRCRRRPSLPWFDYRHRRVDVPAAPASAHSSMLDSLWLAILDGCSHRSRPALLARTHLPMTPLLALAFQDVVLSARATHAPPTASAGAAL